MPRVNGISVRTEQLGGSPLGAAAARGDAPSDWYEPRPRSPGEWKERATRIADDAGSWLDPVAPAMAASGVAARRLEKAARGGLVVTTGQQPGLFGGPLYTWTKALSALALANELEAVSGLPVAPIFWAATDDTDFLEASWTTVAGPEGAEILRMERRDPGEASMMRTPLGDVAGLISRLERSSGSAAGANALDAVRAAYHGDATVGEAYLMLLRTLLEPLGVAVLDASHASVRHAGAPVMRLALARAERVAESVRSRDAAIRAAGFRPQVVEVPGLSLVFQEDADRRTRIPISAAAHLADMFAPEALGPNVLLRPVAERALLPTAAYVGGAAELAYFAQCGAVAAALGLALPLGLPRWSGTIIEPRAARLLRRFEADVDDVRDLHQLHGRLARERIPEDLTTALGELRSAVTRASDGVADATREIVPPAVVAGTRRSLLHRIERFERRVVAAVKRRENELASALTGLQGTLFPGGRRQERSLSFIPLLARYGDELTDLLLRAAGTHAAALISPPAASGDMPAERDGSGAKVGMDVGR